MEQKIKNILTINGGSSSIKFAIYRMARPLPLELSGSVSGIGLNKTEFNIVNHRSGEEKSLKMKRSGFKEALGFLLEQLRKQPDFDHVKVIGHRIVHGMKHTQAEIITAGLIKELENISIYDPDHLPAEIQMIKGFKEEYPDVIQVGCFDTSFHTSIPPEAKTFAIPRKYTDQGIQRYGFHGISYSYLMEELKKEDKKIAGGKIILAHLGNGASLAAVNHGKSIDTSMGFSPAAGIPMSTRTGDLDPGVVWYFTKKGMGAKELNSLINHKSGLLGISGLSADMKELLEKEKEDTNAALAVEVFCYQVKKYIGAYAAALGGVDALIFSGGIGEKAAVIRSRICKGMDYLGIELDQKRNKKNSKQISIDKCKVRVYVIPTNEELMIAKATAEIYKEKFKKKL